MATRFEYDDDAVFMARLVRYIPDGEDPERLERIAERMTTPVYCVDCGELADSGEEHQRGDDGWLCNSCASGI